MDPVTQPTTPAPSPTPAPTTAPAAPAPAPAPAAPVVETERDRVKAAISAMQSAEEPPLAPTTPPPIPPEAAKPAAPKETPDDMVAAAARERAAIRETAAKLKAREEEIERQNSEMRQVFDAIKKDPIEYLNKNADPKWYMDATKRFLNQGAPTPEEIIRRQGQELAELRETVQKIQAGFSMQPYEQQATAYLNNLQAEMSRPEYGIISNDELAVNRVHQLAIEHAQQTKTFLPIGDLLGKVKAERIELHRKLQGYLQPEPQPSNPPTEQRGSPQAGTISYNQTPRASPPVESPDDDFDETARKRRAIAALTGGMSGGR